MTSTATSGTSAGMLRPGLLALAPATCTTIPLPGNVTDDGFPNALDPPPVASPIDGRYVVVRGTRATYKIHIGSGNVLADPGGRYVCIVPAPGAKAPRVLLPFEGDAVLDVVLSKVVLLAADDKITDETILRQLP